MAVALREIENVIGNHTGLSRQVLEYCLLMKRLVDGAKEPGFSAESWSPLAELVAVDEFERVGNFREVMDWRGYVDFLTGWASSSDWECSFKRITESDDLVYLELEERSRTGGHTSVVNSVSVYEFDSAGRIRHLDIYLQMDPPGSAMLKNYERII